jgi:hypothetical protein
MPRPAKPYLSNKTNLADGKLVLEGPSVVDFGRDLQASLVPALELGFAVTSGAIKSTFAALLGGGELTAPVEEIKSAVRALKEMSDNRGENDPLGRKLWQLISNSSVAALSTLFDRHVHLFSLFPGNLFIIEMELLEVTTTEIHIDQSFLSRPNSAIEALGLTTWLEATLQKHFNIERPTLTFLLEQFKSLFDIAVWDEYTRNQEYYRSLITALDSPFSHNLAWHAAMQEHQVRTFAACDSPVLDTPISLATIYIKLRAAVWPKTQDKETASYQVIDAHEALLSWARSVTPAEEVRFVSGGPGSGKSSLATMLCGAIAKDFKFIPIYVRLLDFKWDQSGFESALSRYIERRHPYFPTTPWSREASKILAGKHFVLVFDGLDELSKALGPTGQSQGRALVQSIEQFVREINETVFHNSGRMRAIILGRTAAVQDATRGSLNRHNPGELHLLPLHALDLEQFRLRDAHLSDSGGLGSIDQRMLWWTTYSHHTKSSSDFPETFNSPALMELSSEPLTLSLLAISGYHKQQRRDQVSSVAGVYREILILLYKRDLERRAHAGEMRLSFDEFFRALQVIGYSARFSTERSTTRDQIARVLHEQLNRDRRIFERFESGLQEGVLKLLLASHIRIKEDNSTRDSDEVAYEFSHKTFGEFLAAACLWRTICGVSATFDKDEISPDTAIESFVRLVGTTDVSEDFRVMLRSVVALPEVRWPIDHGELQFGDLQYEDRDHFAARLKMIHDVFIQPMLELVYEKGAPGHRVFSELPMRVLGSIDEQTKAFLWLIRNAITGAHASVGSSALVSSIPDAVLNFRDTRDVRDPADFGFIAQKFPCPISLSGPGVTEGSIFHLQGYASLYNTTFKRCQFLKSDSRLYGRNLFFRECALRDVTWQTPGFGLSEPAEMQTKRRDRHREFNLAAWLRTFGFSLNYMLFGFDGCQLCNVTFRGGTFLDLAFRRCSFENVVFRDCVFVEGTVGFEQLAGIRFENCLLLKLDLGIVEVSGTGCDFTDLFPLDDALWKRISANEFRDSRLEGE